MEEKITVRMWDLGGAMLQMRVSQVKKGGGGGGGGVISHLCQIFVCYTFERKNTYKLTDWKDWGKKIFMYHIIMY